MDELYDDLENYEDVVDVNQLKHENSELKQKLEKCTKSMEILQKDFDLLTAEFKKLESNYSSLLKIARTEIERKTKMITDLNIEKDMLIISAAKNETPNNIQHLVRNVKTMATRKKKRLKNMGDLKEKEDSIRSESDRPSSENSSAVTDSIKKNIVDERVRDVSNSSIGTRSQEKEDSNRDPLGSAVDRRLFALVRHQFSKLSSDEEFEDLYSSLKPKNQPDRKRKRGRDDSQDTKMLYNHLHAKPPNYSDPFTERSVKHRLGRFPSNDRNRHRDKPYNEIDRNVNRDRLYIDSKRHMNDKYESHQRLSPERHRRGAKEHDDYRSMQYDRSRRLESPPRERNLHRSRERRKSFHGRERDDHIHDTFRYNYVETAMVRPKFHGEYVEPHNKRARLEHERPNHDENRRLSEKQYSKEMFASSQRDHTCQSPDFSHTEESSNEPIPEIKSTASTVLEDPRTTSNRYVKSTEANKYLLQSASANNINLQPVNKSLWNLQEVPVPEALRSKPSVVNEDLIDEIDIDKPLSIISMESGEVGSETTDTAMDDMPDIQEVHKSNYNRNSYQNTNRQFGKGHHKEISPVDNMSKDIGYHRNVSKKEIEATKLKKTKQHRSNEAPTTTPPRDKNKLDIHSHSEISEKPSILQKLIDSTCDISPENHKISKLKKRKEHKENFESKISNNTEQEAKRQEHKDYSELRTPSITEPVSERKQHKDTPKLSLSNKTDQEMKDKDRQFDSELKTLVNTEREGKRREQKKTSELCLSKTEQEIKGKDRKYDSELSSTAKTEQESKESERDSKEKERKCEEREQNENSQLRISNKSEQETNGKEHNENSELKPYEKSDQEISKTAEQKEHIELYKSGKETDDGVQVFHDLEHRVFSTRHIVEGDLELSEESNDEEQLKVNEKIQLTKKHKTRRKSTREICKEKHDDLEDTTRKTKSKKNKEKEGKTANKISELFGDSSFSSFSLITPEELNFAPRLDLPAECCPPAPDDAQDGITDTENSVQPLISEYLKGIPETKGISDGSTLDEGSNKTKATKENKNHALHKKRKNSAVISVLDDHDDQALKNTETCSISEVKLVLPNEKLKQLQKAKKQSIDKQYAIKSNETAKSNKKLKSKGEKTLSLDKPPEVYRTRKHSIVVEDSNESRTRKNSIGVEDSNITLTNENKENAHSNDYSEENSDSKTWKIFENTLVSNVSSVTNEKPLPQTTEKDTICNDEAVPNLAPVLDEPGLVKTVVISTGVQLVDPCSAQRVTPFNALASSTPAKDLCAVSTHEIEPKITHSAHVSVTIERDDSVPKPETDVPDVRIIYKRRRKVLKR